MTKSHEVVIIHSDSTDVMEHFKVACSQVKAKLNIPFFVKPIDWIPRPYGYIVVVELPNGVHDVGKLPRLEVGKRKPQ